MEFPHDVDEALLKPLLSMYSKPDFDDYYFIWSDEHHSYASRVDGIERIEEPAFTRREPSVDNPIIDFIIDAPVDPVIWLNPEDATARSMELARRHK